MLELAFISVRILDVIDILLVALILYYIYISIRGTVAINIFVGIFAVYLLWLLVRALKMQLLGTILGQFIGVGVIALIIVFQQELRRLLINIGARYFPRDGHFLSTLFQTPEENKLKIKSIVKASRIMSASKTGALIVIQRKTDLEKTIDLKEKLEANTSSRMLLSIFNKTSPLHDGAVIIRNHKILAARCLLPLTTRELPPEFGTRHRAAVGISDTTDAIVVVVSEETGKITYIENGQMKVGIQSSELLKILEEKFKDVKEEQNQGMFYQFVKKS